MKRKIFYDTIDRTQQGIGRIEQAKTTQKSSLCLILGLTTTEKLSGVSNGSLSGGL